MVSVIKIGNLSRPNRGLFLLFVFMHSKGRTTDAGNIGTFYMLSGFFSTLIISYILDKTGKFKCVLLAVTYNRKRKLALWSADSIV